MRTRPRHVPLEIVGDHMVVRVKGHAAVVDTGSPITFRAPPIVSDQLRQPIRWLVGTDSLLHERVLLDWPNGRVVLGGAALPGEAIELHAHDSGLFQVPIDGEHGRALAWLDTGAPLSYAPASAVRGRRPVGLQKDYMVGIGEYEVAVYELTVRVGRRRIRGRFGVLPELFAMMLSHMGGPLWILGAEFFRARSIQLDLANRLLIDATVVPPRQRTTRRTARGATVAGEVPESFRASEDGMDAWRAWRLMTFGGRPRLQSLTSDDMWDGPCFTADEPPGTEGRSLRSGVHAFATPGQLQSVLRGSALVYGQVTLYGKVCAHEMGYRAEHARVDRLFLRACGRHARIDVPRTGMLLLDMIAADESRAYCACDTLAPGEWLSYEELEALARELGDRYQCDVTIDVERARTPSHACVLTRRGRDVRTLRA